MNEWECLPPCFQSGEKSEISSDPEPNSKQASVNVYAKSGRARAKLCFDCGGAHAMIECFKFKHRSVGDRWKIIKKARVCFACLSSREHRINDCPDKRKCSEPGCERFHHRLLHKELTEKQPSRSKNVGVNEMSDLNVNAETFNLTPQAAKQRSSVTSHQTHAGDAVTVTAKVIAVRIFGANGVFVDDYAFLDDGSSLTMMDQRIAERLGLTGTRENLHLRWTRGITRVEEARKCNVIVSTGLSKPFPIIPAHVPMKLTSYSIISHNTL
jgi:hypothetical protein